MKQKHKQAIKLTDDFVKRCRPNADQTEALFWDAELRGFGMRVSGKKALVKTFIVQRTLPPAYPGAKKKTPRITVGVWPIVTCATARPKAMELLADLHRNINPKVRKVAGMSLLQWSEAYVANRKNLSENTRHEYQEMVKLARNPQQRDGHLADWRDLPLSAITPEMVEHRHSAIAAKIASHRNKAGELSGRNGKAVANRVMQTLRSIWNFAAERVPDLPRNPVNRLRGNYYPEVRRERHLKQEQLKPFYKAVLKLDNSVARDYILLLLWTGLRRREAATLKWEHIHFDQRVIRIPAAMTKAKRKLDLPMTDIVRDLLVTRRSSGVYHQGWIFPSHQAKSGHLVEPKGFMRWACQAAGITPAVSVHDLRRTFITLARSLKVDLLDIKALVNHGLPKSDVTLGYDQTTADDLRASAQTVADKFKMLGAAPSAPVGVVKLPVA